MYRLCTLIVSLDFMVTYIWNDFETLQKKGIYETGNNFMSTFLRP